MSKWARSTLHIGRDSEGHVHSKLVDPHDQLIIFEVTVIIDDSPENALMVDVQD
jgi:hypothetical protein